MIQQPNEAHYFLSVRKGRGNVSVESISEDIDKSPNSVKYPDIIQFRIFTILDQNDTTVKISSFTLV